MKFLAEDDQLTITFEGAEMFFALKRRLIIKRTDIVDLQWTAQFTLTERLWRFWGANIPGSLWSGRFVGGGRRYFLYIQRPPGVSWSRGVVQLPNILSITLEHNFYHYILLTCQPDVGAGLMNWLKESSV